MPESMRYWPLVLWAVAIVNGHGDGHDQGTSTSGKYFRTTDSSPQSFAEFGSIRRKIEYGSHKIQSRSEDDGMYQFTTFIQPPVLGGLITYAQAHLEFPDGSIASADRGVWLHHVVLLNKGRRDTVCSSRVPVQRFFASGNERTPVDLTSGLEPWVGYPVSFNDTMIASGELMNMNDEPQEVVFSMTWEFIPSPPPMFKHAVPVWLDVGGCADSEMPAQPNTHFDYHSPPINSSISGNMAFIGAHLHDGGTHLDVLRNGVVVCSSNAGYGDVDAATDRTAHIASMGICRDVGRVALGDQWSVQAHYDTAKHPPMKSNDGSLEPVMGIALAYVVPYDPPGPGSLHGTSLTLIIIAGVVGLGLSGLYIVRYKSNPIGILCDTIRHRGWRRVRITEAGNLDGEDDAEDGLLLSRKSMGERRYEEL